MIKFFQRIKKCLAACWHLVKEAFQIVHGIWHITGLPTSCISIFGGSRLPENSHYSTMAGELARKLVEHNFSILTGGGPGIMEAANCGAAKAGGTKRIVTLGFSIYGMINETPTNKCVGENGRHIMLNYFFARKWLLTQYSVGFCVFPGGLGTMDELFDLLNLMITHKLPYAPVVLLGTEYWQTYRSWNAIAHSYALIPLDREPKVCITNSIDEAFEYIVSHHQKNTPPRST